MKKGFLALPLFFAAASIFSQDKPASQWAVHKITVDGNAAEWDLPLKNFDQDTKLFFAFRNDSTNLYLCFQSADEMNQARIMRSGMKIILASKINGKHKEIIDFPLPYKRPAGTDSQQPEAERPDRSRMQGNRRSAFLSSDTVMEVKGFEGKNGTLSASDPADIHAAINWDNDNMLTYEIAIPLRDMFGDGYSPGDLSKDISLNVVINALSRPQGSGGGNGSGGYAGGGGRMGGGRMGGSSAGGGMGRGGSGRMGEQQGGGQQADRSALFQKTELKQKFTLAVH